MSEPATAWRALALAPPRAHGGPAGSARLKASEDDFRVEERLGFVADGGVAHLLVKVEKRGCDTLSVARELARLAQAPPRDVGFAGLKDRLAVATQYYTVPAPRPPRELTGLEGPGFRILEAAPHSRKLRRGALTGNAFVVVLRELEAPPGLLAERLARVAAAGVPNYFGPQRFGHGGSNLDSIARFAAGEGLPRAREPRAFVLSAARSLVFNAVLARRVADGSWDRLLPGELVNLAGRNSWFAAGAIDAEVLAEFASLTAALEREGLEAARRPLRLWPEDFRAVAEPGTLRLEFRLPAGGYATAVLRELVATTDTPLEPEDA